MRIFLPVRYEEKGLVLKSISENIQESRKEWILRIFNNTGKYNCNHKVIRSEDKTISLLT